MVSSTLSRRRCQPSRFARLHYDVDMSKQLITICLATVTRKHAWHCLRPIGTLFLYHCVKSPGGG